jgi:hypothetical protein
METNPKSPEKPLISTPDPIPRVSAEKYRGLGDLVHAVANPVARVIDAVAGTHIQGCAGCGRRREKWNRRFPL